MILVDTNVILDVINRDEKWFDWSAQMIREQGDSELFINVVIYTELIPAFREADEVRGFLRKSPFLRKPLPFAAAAPAARAFKEYRSRGGVKTAPLPDFFIGAHAEADGLKILTRDTKRYRMYFPEVSLICP